MPEPVNTKSFISWFNPASSSHDALNQFKKLTGLKQFLVLAASVFGSILPIAGNCAIFRKATQILSPSDNISLNKEVSKTNTAVINTGVIKNSEPIVLDLAKMNNDEDILVVLHQNPSEYNKLPNEKKSNIDFAYKMLDEVSTFKKRELFEIITKYINKDELIKKLMNEQPGILLIVDVDDTTKKKAKEQNDALIMKNAIKDQVAKARAKTEQMEKTRVEQNAKAIADAKAKTEQMEKTRIEQNAKAIADAKAKTEQMEKTRVEQNAKAIADAKAKTEQEAKAQQEAQAKAEQEAKIPKRIPDELAATNPEFGTIANHYQQILANTNDKNKFVEALNWVMHYVDISSSNRKNFLNAYIERGVNANWITRSESLEYYSAVEKNTGPKVKW